MKVIDFLTQLKDTPLNAELEFVIPEHCCCSELGQRCYCSLKNKQAVVEVVCFEKDKTTFHSTKAVVHLTEK
jgi:hypothetical protein